MKSWCNRETMDSVFGPRSEIYGIEYEKESKIAFFQKKIQKKPWSRFF